MGGYKQHDEWMRWCHYMSPFFNFIVIYFKGRRQGEECEAGSSHPLTPKMQQLQLHQAEAGSQESHPERSQGATYWSQSPAEGAADAADAEGAEGAEDAEDADRRLHSNKKVARRARPVGLEPWHFNMRRQVPQASSFFLPVTFYMWGFYLKSLYIV